MRRPLTAIPGWQPGFHGSILPGLRLLPIIRTKKNEEPLSLNMRTTEHGRGLETAGNKGLPEQSPEEREMRLGGFSVRSDNEWRAGTGLVACGRQGRVKTTRVA